MQEIESIFSELEHIGEDFVFENMKEAMAKLTKESSGGGCGCNACLHKAVNDWNGWLDMIQGDEEHREQYRAFIDWRFNKPKVVFGYDPNPPYNPTAPQ